MKIIPAELEHAEGLAEVSVKVWWSTYKEIMPRTYLDKMTVEKRTKGWKEKIKANEMWIFVALEDEKVIGYISGGPNRNQPLEFDGELYAIYILREYQRKGVGILLTRRLMECMEQAGYKNLIVWLLNNNHAWRFYEALGGEKVAEDSLEIEGVRLPLAGFGWNSLPKLVETLTLNKE
ncbi:GNAT family N-acetyltransferase [Halobacillus salinarum]|uniref:GNAT family N-acetyltransferase n=1 Tax=Halobacillus salinarum TaxID=2932257 RepID=A0ABY4EGG1_9BACI|nr:GNAT family N-acetyltransferase [Halobacillus salinarum]UOQ43545.1 GNAT family N-acetyltransferase [Halobacillus salinarum]